MTRDRRNAKGRGKSYSECVNNQPERKAMDSWSMRRGVDDRQPGIWARFDSISIN